MFPIWLAWGLLVAVQGTNEHLGQVDMASPYGGLMYGERVWFALACLAFVAVIYGWGPRRNWSFCQVSGMAVAACVSALLASPELSRQAFPAVMAFAQLMMAFQLLSWAAWQEGQKLQLMAIVLPIMQGIAFGAFVYAQTSIGLTPAPSGAPGSALFYLGEGWMHLAWVALGTALLAAATLWKRG